MSVVSDIPRENTASKFFVELSNSGPQRVAHRLVLLSGEVVTNLQQYEKQKNNVVFCYILFSLQFKGFLYFEILGFLCFWC